ncbi:MAG: hypothetical protein ACLP7Q_13765 [Isosphaeraceae bacterium]
MILSSVLLLATGQAPANYYELLRRVPESANTIILIDVERMLMSPIAMKERWREKGNSEGVALHFPINSVRYMLASKLDFTSNFDDQGDIALIETPESVSLPFLAKTEGGYLDAIDDQEVVHSPRDAFFVSLKPNILGVSFPAKRQELGRWLRSLKRLDPPQVSEYLQQAVKLAHGKDQMVIAMDLTDLFTPRMVRDRLHRAESVAGRNVDLDTLTRVLTSARGVTLTMAATDRLQGKIRLDLGESASPMKDVAKALFIEVLEQNEMLLEEMKDWRLVLEANAISLEGRLSSQGLRRLTELIPFPADTIELKQPGNEPSETSPVPQSTGASSARDAKVTASKKYFQRISQRLSDLRTEVKEAPKAKFAQKMLNDAARELDRMPVLNVDEELLAYGSGVSSTLRNMRNLSKNAGLDYQYRMAEIQSNAGYGYGGGTVAGATTSTHRQMTAVLQSNELAILTMLEEKTAEIRKKMTLKYQVEF